ncbi:MAG: DUF2334 domain-containing protein [Pseudomonadota bacterium]
MKNSETKKGNAVLCIHDIAPSYENEIFDIITELKRLEINKFNLGIVPSFHDQYHLSNFPGFCSEIKTFMKDFEIELILHGYFHKRMLQNEHLSIKGDLISRVVSNKEDEFFELPASETKLRIERGLKLIENIFNINCYGFLPPAWIMNEHLLKILTNLEFYHTENHFHIYNLNRQTKIFSPVISFASRTQARQYSSVAWSSLLSSFKFSNHLLRFVIHPCDFRSPIVKKTIIANLEKILKNYNLHLYRELIV